MNNIDEWNIDEQDIKNVVDTYIENYNKLISNILSIPINEQKFSNTFAIINKYQIENHFAVNKVIFLQNVLSNENIINASIDAEKKINEFNININMRPDLYELAKRIWDKEHKLLSGENIRYLEDILNIFHRNGLDLDKNIQEQIKLLNNELSNLCTEYSVNLMSDSSTIQFTRKELEGLPELFFENIKLPIDDNDEIGGNSNELFTLTTKYPHVFPILEKAKLEETRKKMEFIFNTRCKNNINILFKIIQLRQQIANLLGYKTWADYVLEDNMAKSSQKVLIFLSKLVEKLKPLRDKELNMMKSKKGDTIYQHDWRYYLDQEIMENYNIDSELIREYFPLNNVLKHMLNYFQKIFGLKFIKEEEKAWHEDVETWLVHDIKEKRIIGKFYFDLFPRDNKFTHAACFSLKYATNDDSYCICAMVCNFNNPVNDIPSLLAHNEVETLYHEFGHVMHNICSRTTYVEYSGTQTERDFVEAPSQMLENWCWEFSTIKKISKHYKTNKQLSDDLINKLIATRYVGSGITNCRQLVLALTDQIIHSQNFETAQELEDVYNKNCTDIMGITNNPDMYYLSIFGHLAGGYDAQYYGYMWSKVYAEDMYEHFKNLGSKGGILFRKKILEFGGAKDGSELVYLFLGRDVDNTMFLKRLGI
jgi:thimet oligopeptidase